MTEAAAQFLTLYATVQETLLDHEGGYSHVRDELVIEDTNYDRALEAARRRVHAGWRSVALRVERAGT